MVEGGIVLQERNELSLYEARRANRNRYFFNFSRSQTSTNRPLSEQRRLFYLSQRGSLYTLSDKSRVDQLMTFAFLSCLYIESEWRVLISAKMMILEDEWRSSFTLSSPLRRIYIRAGKLKTGDRGRLNKISFKFIATTAATPIYIAGGISRLAHHTHVHTHSAFRASVSHIISTSRN